MAIADLLNTISQSQLNPTGIQTKQQPTIKRVNLKTFNTPVGPIISSANPNQNRSFATQNLLQSAKNNAQQTYNNNKQVQASDLAQRVLDQSAGYVATDKYGIVQQTPSNAKQIISSSISTIGKIGDTALQGAQDQATWQRLKQLQLNNNYSVSSVFNTNYDSNLLPAGSNHNNLGAQAVAIALTTMQNGTPYKWGGNSLVNGVDCSGLVQQVYAKLGVKLPRTTYEQAKSGQMIHGVQNALPGDLIFYNTGRLDPNGIGTNSHVGIYVGNGKVIEALNSRVGIRIEDINYMPLSGTIIRPWS